MSSLFSAEDRALVNWDASPIHLLAHCKLVHTARLGVWPQPIRQVRYKFGQAGKPDVRGVLGRRGAKVTR